MPIPQQKVKQTTLSAYKNRHGLYITVSVLFLSLCVTVPIFTKMHPALDYNAFNQDLSAMFTITGTALTPNKTSMQPQPKRIIIFTADVMKIYECSESTASRKLNQCRFALAKLKHQSISIKEFCEYFSLNYADVCQQLKLV